MGRERRRQNQVLRFDCLSAGADLLRRDAAQDQADDRHVVDVDGDVHARLEAPLVDREPSAAFRGVEGRPDKSIERDWGRHTIWAHPRSSHVRTNAWGPAIDGERFQNSPFVLFPRSAAYEVVVHH